MKRMENPLIILDMLKIFGALLFIALAAAFQRGKAFSGFFRIYLLIQALTVLSYSRETAEVAAIRMERPLGFAIGTLPFVFLMPFLLFTALSVTVRLNRKNTLLAGSAAGAGLLLLLAAGFLPRGGRLLPGPGAPALASWIWNFWHLAWTAASAAILFKTSPGGLSGDKRLERRVLKSMTLLAFMVIVVSIILERISFQLDFLITPLFIVISAYAALAVLIVKAPTLLKMSRERYADSDLSGDEAEILACRAEEILIKGRLWQRPGLVVGDIAEACAASSRDLSQSINGVFSMGVPAWINSHRLIDAEERLISTREKVTDIAFAVGFNSLSSFNAAFKEKNGKTPLQWRKTNRDSEPKMSNS